MNEKSNKTRIVILDDEPVLGQLYRDRLIEEGYDVRYCSDAESGLQAIREFQPKLVMMDLMMPRLSGFDAIDLLRNMPGGSDLKIVVVSALSQPDDIAHAKALGADDYCIKADMTTDEIVARIKSVLANDQADLNLNS